MNPALTTCSLSNRKQTCFWHQLVIIKEDLKKNQKTFVFHIKWENLIKYVYMDDQYSLMNKKKENSRLESSLKSNLHFNQ